MQKRLKEKFAGFYKDEDGDLSAIGYIIGGLVILLMIVNYFFTPSMEKFVLDIRAGAIRRGVEASIKAAHAAIVLREEGKRKPSIDEDEFNQVFLHYLRANMSLDNELRPLEGSPIQGRLRVLELEVIQGSSLPYSNPTTGVIYHRPVVKTKLSIPLTPVLHREKLKEEIGNDFIIADLDYVISLPLDD